jgi:hypothetical protein
LRKTDEAPNGSIGTQGDPTSNDRQQSSEVLSDRLLTSVVSSLIDSLAAAVFAGVGRSTAVETVLSSSVPAASTALISFVKSDSPTSDRFSTAVSTLASDDSTAEIVDLLRGVWLICVTAEPRESTALHRLEGVPPELQLTKMAAAPVVDTTREQRR